MTIQYFFLAIAMVFSACSGSKKAAKVINAAEVERIEATLSADNMEGRRVFTAGIEKASSFIASEMKAAGLKQFQNNTGYLQSFEMLRPSVASASGFVGKDSVKADNIFARSTLNKISFDEKASYRIERLHKGELFNQKLRPFMTARENVLLLMDTSFQKDFGFLKTFRSPMFPQQHAMVAVLTSDVDAAEFNITIEQSLTPEKLSNVVGLLPGKSKPGEYVIFSAHYDHLGFGKPDEKGDSLYNGANDDASGTTAMLMLARYFRILGNNERSLLFVAFTAEEAGGFGSKHFSGTVNPADVVAMFNIEMIGTESKWGNKSAYITGYEKSDFGKILEHNLAGSGFTFYPDPYPQQQLFYRSDNATLARQGVPAHTISTSKMDNEPHYHKPSDEVSTLDMKNMTEIIKAIAKSATSIVSGKDTPTRVDQSALSR